jgi:hypothetical protein
LASACAHSTRGPFPAPSDAQIENAVAIRAHVEHVAVAEAVIIQRWSRDRVNGEIAS